MDYIITTFGIQKIIGMQREICALQSRNTKLENDLDAIVDSIQEKGVLTIGDMAMLAVNRRLAKGAPTQ